jgi:hypothetical protein
MAPTHRHHQRSGPDRVPLRHRRKHSPDHAADDERGAGSPQHVGNVTEDEIAPVALCRTREHGVGRIEKWCAAERGHRSHDEWPDAMPKDIAKSAQAVRRRVKARNRATTSRNALLDSQPIAVGAGSRCFSAMEASARRAGAVFVARNALPACARAATRGHGRAHTPRGAPNKLTARAWSCPTSMRGTRAPRRRPSSRRLRRLRPSG